MKIPCTKYEIQLRTSKQPRPSAWDDFWYETSASLETNTGLKINQDTALRYSAVWACVKVISEDLSSLPVMTYQRLSRGKKRAVEHPLYTLLHNAPNPEMSAMQFRECLQAHLLTWGNGYAEIQRSKINQPKALWPLRPDRMEVSRTPDEELLYTYNLTNGERVNFRKEDILHIAGLGFNGLIGYSPIGYQREAIGLGIASEEFGARYFQGDSTGRIVLEHPGVLTPEAKEKLKAAWSAAYGGLSNAHRVAVLEEAMKIEKLGFPNSDAQFIETRKFQTNDIARIFRVPPHKIMDLDKATFSNIEHQGIDYVTGTLRPWAVRWEQAINQRVLLGNDAYFVEHLMDALLRGDILSRYQAYAVGRNWGWLSVNEIREFENMNPIEEGDSYLQPLNMTELGADPQEPISDEEKERAARFVRKLQVIRRTSNVS